MTKITKSGVCYDMDNTPYVVNQYYRVSDQLISYHLSSVYNQNNFIRRMNEHREKIKDSLTKRFGYEAQNNVIADLQLYQMIEKRGFLIKLDGETIRCLDDLKLDGSQMTKKN